MLLVTNVVRLVELGSEITRRHVVLILVSKNCQSEGDTLRHSQPMQFLEQRWHVIELPTSVNWLGYSFCGYVQDVRSWDLLHILKISFIVYRYSGCWLQCLLTGSLAENRLREVERRGRFRYRWIERWSIRRRTLNLYFITRHCVQNMVSFGLRIFGNDAKQCHSLNQQLIEVITVDHWGLELVLNMDQWQQTTCYQLSPGHWYDTQM